MLYFTSQSRGVAILIDKNIPFQMESVDKDKLYYFKRHNCYAENNIGKHIPP